MKKKRNNNEIELFAIYKSKSRIAILVNVNEETNEISYYVLPPFKGEHKFNTRCEYFLMFYKKVK